jgi:predicted nucleic acid-binding Zn ribbon protein
MCQDCGTKWFIPEHRVSEPDLTECDACGGPLAKLAGYPGNDGYDSRRGAGADESES